jgi:hypothetical protein
MNTTPMKGISGLPVRNVIPTTPRRRQEMHGGYPISSNRDFFNPQGMKGFIPESFSLQFTPQMVGNSPVSLNF